MCKVIATHCRKILQSVRESARPMPDGKYPLAKGVTHATIAIEMCLRAVNAFDHGRATNYAAMVLNDLLQRADDLPSIVQKDDPPFYWAEMACVMAIKSAISINALCSTQDEREVQSHMKEAVDSAAHARLYHIKARIGGQADFAVDEILQSTSSSLMPKTLVPL